MTKEQQEESTEPSTVKAVPLSSKVENGSVACKRALGLYNKRFKYESDSSWKYFEVDVKEAVEMFQQIKRFKQTGKELSEELGIVNIQDIQKIQLMFTEILMEHNKIMGEFE